MRVIALALFLLLTMKAPAQIVLSAAYYPPDVTGVDSIKQTTALSPFPSLVAGMSHTWDMTGMTDSVPVVYQHRVHVSGYDYGDSGAGRIFAYDFTKTQFAKFESWGIALYGSKIYDTSYSLSTLTFGFTDSFFIPQQTAVYSSPDIVVPFPATYGTTWNANYYYDVAYKLSLAFPPNDHTPGYVRRFVSKSHTVTGWGWARINDITGFPAPDVPVLQVSTRTITADSFYLGGVPLPGTLITLFGVQQGKADTVYEQQYLRRGEVTPLVNVRFRDAGYTQPVWAKKHVQRLLPDGVELVKEKTTVVYPNPVSGSQLTITGMPGKTRYELADVLGRIVISGVYNNIAVEIPLSIVNGVYYLRLDADNHSKVVPVTIHR